MTFHCQHTIHAWKVSNIVSMEILKLLKSSASISPETLGTFTGLSKRESYSKGKVILSPGEICRKIYLIEKGILRFYYYDEQGKDITHHFIFEGDLVTEVHSFFNLEKSEYYIETLEDTDVHTHTLEDFEYMVSNFPEVEKMARIIFMEFVLEFGEKIKDLQFRDAKTRYENLLHKHPDILQRINLGHIASYLGITQQSLSRIRKQP